MTTAQKQSAINRFNDRLHQIGKAFGKDSYQYTQYQRKLELLVGSKNMTKSGRAGRGKKVVENISDDDIRAMDQQSTAGQIKVWGSVIYDYLLKSGLDIFLSLYHAMRGISKKKFHILGLYKQKKRWYNTQAFKKAMHRWLNG